MTAAEIGWFTAGFYADGFEQQYRALVSGFQPAHPKHGGGGAFYVKLRRIRP